MFVQYFALKDVQHLPISGKYVDPYDNSVHIPSNKESLDQFIHRITESRDQKGLPVLNKKDLEVYAVASLAETCSDKDLQKYFYQKAEIPEFGRVAALARTIIQQRVHGKEASFSQRQDRATKCGGCKFHKSRGGVKNFATKIIQKVAGLDDVVQSPLEKELGTCGMCGCNLPTKIRFDLAAVLASISPEEINQLISSYGSKAFDVCWILNEAIVSPITKKNLEAKLSRISPKATASLQEYLTSKVAEARNNGTTKKD